MSKSLKFSLVVIGAAALLAVFLASGQRKPDAPAPQPAPPQAVAPAVRPAPAPAPAAAAVPTPQVAVPAAAPVVAVERPAPPSTPPPRKAEPRMPIRDLDAALRQIALQGDAQASCRLGIELIRCVRVDYRQAMLLSARNGVLQMPKDSPQAIAKTQELDAVKRLLDEDRAICGSGVPQESARDAWRYLYLSANAGNVAAMSQFARDPGLDPRDEKAKEGWETYVRRAPAFLTAAIEGGDVKALYQGWLSAWSGASASTIKTFERDPDKALQYGLVVVGLIDAQRAEEVMRANEMLAKEVGPERAAKAKQEAESLRMASFADANAPIEWGGPDNGYSDAVDCQK